MQPVQFIRNHQHEIVVAWRQLRQRAFVARVRVMAKWERARVDFEFAPDVRCTISLFGN